MNRLLFGVMLLAVTACGSTQTAAQSPASQQSTPDTIVAELGGRKITLKEIDEKWQSLDPAERMRVTQLLYQNRRNVLDLLVGDLLIDEAAKAAGVPAAEYLEQETKKRTKTVAEADVKAFYETNKERAQGRTFDELRPQISTYLQGQREQQARAQLVDDLKSKRGADLRVLLDPPRQTIEISPDDPASGPQNAPITIVEFSDYQCPFCARVVPTLTKIRSTYGDKVRLVFKDFPLPNHPQAPKAAEAAHCAGEQGKYWPMHDRLFANQQALQLPQLKEHAAAIGLDATKFGECLDSGKHAAAVTKDLEYGNQLGVSSTPTVYVNGRAVVGAQPFEYFKSVIDEELARK
jgi:protein-disulfide isomerase